MHDDMAARAAIQALLDGHAPPDAPPDLGRWTALYADLANARASGGVIAVRMAFDALARAHPGLIRLLAGDGSAARPAADAMPPLPESAAQIQDQAAPCAAWLDRYIAFGRAAAPMTPPAFHEAAGLFAASVAIARRLALPASTTTIYPNLFLLFVAPSTIYRKTTGLHVLAELFRRADLTHLLLPQRMTPEAVVQELGTAIPSTLGSWEETTRAEWLRERAFAGQRGWMLDEASGLFDGLKRDFNAGLMALMLDLYECKERTNEQTIGRGRVTINRAYLSFFGVATPAGMREHFGNPHLWTNGLWARFALIAPDAPPHWAFFPPELAYPFDLIDGVRRLAARFPTPAARLVETEDEGGGKRKVVAVEGETAPTAAALGAGVWGAWDAYSHALHSLIAQGEVPEALHGTYGRLGTQAIKIALCLAALDAESASVRVEARHFARAQQIAERWRASAHQIWRTGVATEEAHLSDKLLLALAQAGPAGALARDLYRPLGIRAKDARDMLEELRLAGQVERVETSGANGRQTEIWRLLTAHTIPEVSKSQ